MTNYIKQSMPIQIPTGDGKTIKEYFGLVSTRSTECSIAHMIVPPGWIEPYQNPMIPGKKIAEVDGEKIELRVGECLLVKRGAKVRYSNPFDKQAEYWSVCIPAFSIERVHRD